MVARLPFLALSIALGAGLLPMGMAAARPAPARPVRIAETGPDYRFLYTYPAAAAAIPGLSRSLRKEAAEALADLRGQAGAGREAGANYPMTYDQEWRIAANTRQLLAISAIASAYWGGSHGAERHLAVMWSKSANRRLALGELFSRPKTGLAVLSAAFCSQFTAMRRARLAKEGEKAGPTRCPEAEQAAIVPVAGRGGGIARFRMMLGGEETQDGYAGGSYEIYVPVSTRIRALIKPRFAQSFAPERR